LLDKHLAHISIRRSNLFGHRWNLDALANAINAIAATFLKQLEAESPERFAQLRPWFQFAKRTPLRTHIDNTPIDRSSVRSGMDVVQISPSGMPSSALAGWTNQYMKKKRLKWPT